MVQLLTDPGAFAGSRIHVQGFLATGPGLALFLTKEHAELFDYVSSISVTDTTPDGYLNLKCAGYHAVVVGTLRKSAEAPLIHGPSGTSLLYVITDVERIAVYREHGLEECWPRSGVE